MSATRAAPSVHANMSSAALPPVSWKPGERVCSLEELYSAASIKPSRKMPLSKYFKDLENTLEKAKKRLLEQDLQYSYVFYLRYVILVLKHLPTHPEYNKHEFRRERDKVSENAKSALSMLERLQPVLKQRHEEYVRYLESIPRPKASVSTYSTRRGSSVKRASIGGLDMMGAWRHDGGNATNNDMSRFSLADTLQGLNLGHASSDDKTYHHHSASLGSKPQAPVHGGGAKEATLIEYPAVTTSPTQGFSWQPEQLRRASQDILPLKPQPMLNSSANDLHQQSPTPPRIPPRPKAPPTLSADILPTAPYSPVSPAVSTEQPHVCPALPPKPQEYHEGLSAGRINEQSAGSGEPPLADDPLKSFMPECLIGPDHYSLTEGGVRMRPIQMPEGIFDEFIDIASANTLANLETCGVLCGKQVPGQDALIMTTLIIPKQRATSDTCTTEHEEELFVVQMDRELITLGWIHTHPSQTCFMSSLDLHTQCSYQLMLPEAIAIVCAPRHEPRFGIFRLTDPTGIDVITNCKEKSAFHPHDPSKQIYTDADTGGHVVFVNYDFDIIDIRGD